MLPTTTPKLDKNGHPKPPARAYVNGKSIWFQLWRIAPPGHQWDGEWAPITRTHTKTAKRAAMVRRVLNARILAGGK